MGYCLGGGYAGVAADIPPTIACLASQQAYEVPRKGIYLSRLLLDGATGILTWLWKWVEILSGREPTFLLAARGRDRARSGGRPECR